MKRTVAVILGAKGRPLLLLLLVILSTSLVFGGCESRKGLGASESWSGVALQPDGSAGFVGTRDGRIIELLFNNGTSQAPTQGAIFDATQRPEGKQKARVGAAFYGVPTIANGHVYAGSYEGFVYSMLAEGTGNGTALSNVNGFEIDGDNLSKGIEGSVVYSNGLLVAAASETINTGRLYVLNADKLDSGASAADVEHCRYPAGTDSGLGRVWTTPLVLNGIAYFGDLSHHVYAVNIDTCKLVWPAPAEVGGSVVATPVAVNGKLYVGAFNGEMYSIDMATGAVEELFKANNWFWATPVTDGTMLYAPNLDGVLYAYDISSHSLAWQYDQEGTKSTLLANPALVNGDVVIASDSGTITVVDSSGNRVADFAIPGDKIRAAVTTNGTTIYVHTLKELIESFTVSNGGIKKDWDFQLPGF